MSNEITNNEQFTTDKAQPRPFKEIPELWLKITNMDEDFFMNETLHVSPSNTLYGILVFAVIVIAYWIIQSVPSTLIGIYTGTGIELPDFMTNIAVITSMLICYGLIGTPASFYIGNGINFLSAYIFGGTGKFNTQAYLYSLIVVPLGLLSILSSFISLIPIIGPCIYGLVSIGIRIFQIILTIRLFKVVHHFSTNRAVVAILSPILLLLIPLVLIFVLLLTGPMIGNIFSSINAGY